MTTEVVKSHKHRSPSNQRGVERHYARACRNAVGVLNSVLRTLPDLDADSIRGLVEAYQDEMVEALASGNTGGRLCEECMSRALAKCTAEQINRD